LVDIAVEVGLGKRDHTARQGNALTLDLYSSVKHLMKDRDPAISPFKDIPRKYRLLVLCAGAVLVVAYLALLLKLSLGAGGL
jgi:hypothetical protein